MVVEQKIRRAVAKGVADYTEVRIERKWSSHVLFSKNKLANLTASAESGGIVRCLTHGGWGISVFNDLSLLDRSIDEATRAAQLVGKRSRSDVVLSEVPTVEDEYRIDPADDTRTVPLDEKRRTAEKYNRIILNESSKIVSSRVEYVDALSEITFASSEGTYIVQELPDVTLSLSATAGERGNTQMAFEDLGRAGGFRHALGQEEAARAAARRAVALLSARTPEGGCQTVILDPLVGGGIIHEALGHICEADNVFKDERLAEIMTIGNRFGTDELTVVDDGFVPGARGNIPYDDEGVKRRSTILVKEGLLTGLLHSRETAGKLGAEPRGNARALSYEHAPIVRMNNTYVANGGRTFEEMVRGTRRGVYAVGKYGGTTALEQYEMTSAYGYEIVDGELGDLIRAVTVSGNLFETLMQIDMIGDDTECLGGSGGCGKDGQYPLPLTEGAPHIRIQSMRVGGK